MRNAVHMERTFRPPVFHLEISVVWAWHSIVFSIVLQITFPLKQSQLFVYDNCQKTWAVCKHNKYFQSFPISKKKVATYLWSTKMLFAHCYVLRTQGNLFCYAEFRCYLLANIFKNPPSNIILDMYYPFISVCYSRFNLCYKLFNIREPLELQKVCAYFLKPSP